MFIYLTEHDDGCTLQVSRRYTHTDDPQTYIHSLNDNHSDDMREISEVIGVHIFAGCKVQVHHDFETIKQVICKVVNAHVRNRVSMLFLQTYVRRATIAIGCIRVHSRRLPRDLLREIAGWLRVDDAEELYRIFYRHLDIRQINGLRLKATYDGVCGPPVRVSGMRVRVNQASWQTCFLLCIDGKGRVLSYLHRGKPGSHFNLWLCGKEMHLVGLPPAGIDVYKVPVEFDADPAIEFTHKCLDKLTACVDRPQS